MGYIRDHAIVVVGTYDHWIDLAHTEAVRIFPWVSKVSPKAMNDSQSFFVPPDGSKEGWESSDTGDARRAEFAAWLRSVSFEDGSCPLSWVDVRVSDDEDQLLIEHSDMESRVPDAS